MSASSIIALHGNLGSADDWERLEIEGMVAIDLWAYSDLSLEEFARFLTKEMRPAGERPVIAGYSLGGRLALKAMSDFPDAWEGAVILSAHPGLDDRGAREMRRDIDGDWARRARDMNWPDFLELWNSQPVLANSPASDRQLDLEKRRDAIAMAFDHWSLGIHDVLREPLKEFDQPVLWITGADDEKFHGVGEEMAEVFSKFEHVALPEHGHRVLDSPAAVKIRDWLAHL